MKQVGSVRDDWSPRRAVAQSIVYILISTRHRTKNAIGHCVKQTKDAMRHSVKETKDAVRHSLKETKDAISEWFMGETKKIRCWHAMVNSPAWHLTRRNRCRKDRREYKEEKRYSIHLHHSPQQTRPDRLMRTTGGEETGRADDIFSGWHQTKPDRMAQADWREEMSRKDGLFVCMALNKRRQTDIGHIQEKGWSEMIAFHTVRCDRAYRDRTEKIGTLISEYSK